MMERRSRVEVLVTVAEIVRSDQHLADDHAFGGEQFSVGRHEVDLADSRQRLQSLGLRGPLNVEPLHTSGDRAGGDHDDFVAGGAYPRHIGCQLRDSVQVDPPIRCGDGRRPDLGNQP